MEKSKTALFALVMIGCVAAAVVLVVVFAEMDTMGAAINFAKSLGNGSISLP